MSELNWQEKFRQYFDQQTEENIFKETLSGLQRATKARDVAEQVSKLFEVGSIHSDLVVTKDFIETLIGIATNLKVGNSINNVREHINKVIARDKWKQREEEEKRQRRPYKIGKDTVTITFDVTIDREKFAVIQELVRQAHMILSQVVVSHFDGNPKLEREAYQLCGSSESISTLLGRIADEAGMDALVDISYSSPANGFERDHLTLLQTRQLADYESQI